ncbi:MAG TPA: hypothetical protein VKE71_05450 [Candidatus Angelobacter sp.]|nr:hypothetical protein [Candidatus Angelobacter sp.]
MRFFQFLQVGLITAVVTLLSPSQERAKTQTEEPSVIFTEADASKLLSQVAEGLQGHSPRKMLGAFDLSRMDGGPQFKEQITAFFNQYDTIRVHFKLVQVKDDEATVDAEIDGTPRNAITPPEHKRLQLRFTVGKTAAGWKFVDVQPRGFFS